MTQLDTRAEGTDTERIEGPDKVTGAAVYAAETPGRSDVAWVWPVLSTIAKGRVREIDTDAVLGRPQILAVLTHDNAPRLEPPDDAELAVLQDADVAYRGQIVAAVVAGSVEAAREAAEHLPVHYDEQPHDVSLSADRDDLYTPDTVNPGFPTVTDDGDVDAGLARSAYVVDEWYETPMQHNNPMEPHATLAAWHDGELSVHDSNQGSYSAQQTLAKLFDLPPERVHVTNPHVGGGFGSKGTIRPNCVLAAMAAKVVQRPVKITLHRKHLFSLVGHRTPTLQRIRLGADAEGRLTAIDHQVVEQTSTVKEFAEQTAVATRLMYSSPSRRTGHRLARLDVPSPSWFRAPGECPGMFALESAMDELAIATGIDPIELRVRNEPPVEPSSGDPWSGRNLVGCLREGARRFGWADRDPRPAQRLDGWSWVGTGVAAGTYPAYAAPSTATARAEPDGTFTVRIAATDLGTGARTALTQIAADALHAPLGQVRVHIGNSDFGQAQLAGGSSGTASWGWAITKACRQLRDQLVGLAEVPAAGVEVTAETSEEIKARKGYAYHSFSAVFAEVRVDVDTGEVRVPRLLGVFSAGRIINPRTARSQFLGGLIMGLSMALHEEALIDPAFGDTVNHDLAEYHVATNADVLDIQAHWLDETDEHANPMGAKGIGEIGIVGTAAAVANAVHHATGVRVRDLPIRLDKLIGRMPAGRV